MLKAGKAAESAKHLQQALDMKVRAWYTGEGGPHALCAVHEVRSCIPAPSKRQVPCEHCTLSARHPY